MILVTGATGTFGKAVVQMLKKENEQVRAGSRNTQPPLEWNKPETFKDVLSGIEKVFIVSPPNYSTFPEKVDVFLKTARELGVKFILLSTVYGINQAPDSALAKTEEVVKNSGIKHAIIRPNFIFQNFINFDSEAIKSGKIYLPTGESKTSYIDVRDVATACATILTNSANHEGNIYTLTGSASLSHDEIAQLFTEVLGVKVENMKPSSEEYKQVLTSYGLPEDTVNFLGYLYSGIEAGHFSSITNDFEKITNKTPTTIKTFIQDFKDIFA